MGVGVGELTAVSDLVSISSFAPPTSIGASRPVANGTELVSTLVDCSVLPVPTLSCASPATGSSINNAEFYSTSDSTSTSSSTSGCFSFCIPLSPISFATTLNVAIIEEDVGAIGVLLRLPFSADCWLGPELDLVAHVHAHAVSVSDLSPSLLFFHSS